MERILGIIAKQTGSDLDSAIYLTRKKSLKFSESLKLLFLEAAGLNKRLILGLTQSFFASDYPSAAMGRSRMLETWSSKGTHEWECYFLNQPYIEKKYTQGNSLESSKIPAWRQLF